MADLESIYKRKNGKVLIEIDLLSIMQIFNTLDPSPFFEKQLDTDAENYIVDTVNEFPKNTPFIIVIHLPKEQADCEEARAIPAAIKNHFEYRALATDRRFRQRARYGRINLVLSLIFLAISHTLSNIIDMNFGNQMLFSYIAEALDIAGWVAMWAPVTLLLYELYPIIQTKNVFERISTMEIEIQPK